MTIKNKLVLVRDPKKELMKKTTEYDLTEESWIFSQDFNSNKAEKWTGGDLNPNHSGDVTRDLPIFFYDKKLNPNPSEKKSIS